MWGCPLICSATLRSTTHAAKSRFLHLASLFYLSAPFTHNPRLLIDRIEPFTRPLHELLPNYIHNRLLRLMQDTWTSSC
jgi:hypothetical protein